MTAIHRPNDPMPIEIEGWRIGHPHYPDQRAPIFVCGETLTCGGICYRSVGHLGSCLCVGDFGVPGECPA